MSGSAKDFVDRLRFCMDGRDLTDRQEAVIGATALFLIDVIARSPQDMRERGAALAELFRTMGD